MAGYRLSGAPQRRGVVAAGFIRQGGAKQIAIRFDPDTFAEVERLAQRDHVSFGEKIRQLVEWGLEPSQD